MKRTLKSLLALTVLISAAPASAAVPTFIPRSQSVNAAREMVGWQQFINLCDMDCLYGAFSITGEYTRSFRQGRLAQCLFGQSASCSSDCGATIKVSGSTVENRGANDWFADYFGLPTDFESTLTFNPRIQNGLVDLNLYLGLDELACGMWFRVHAPIVWTRWNLNFCETVINKGVAEHVAGYFNGADGVPRADLLNNATEFFSGAKAPTLGTSCDAGAITFQKLAASKFSTDGCDCKGLTKTRLSDIEFALGWNFWCCEDYLVGLSIRASAPTGNKPCGEYFFEPLVGDGHHWKLGGGLNAQSIFWRSDCSDASFGFFLDARVQHLFKACQTRTFDLCGKPNSRYMLAQQLGSTRGTNHYIAPCPAGIASGADADAGVEWQNVFAPVANLTRSNVDVDIAVEGDVALKFAYMSDCWEFDLGYEFWARSCERFCKRTNCAPNGLTNDTTWALKGDAQVIGFGDDFSGGCYCVRLAATESQATIHNGTNGHTGPTFFDPQTAITDTAQPVTNPGIDNAVLACDEVGSTVRAQSTCPAIGQTGGYAQIRSSNAPVYITAADIDLSGIKGISNKIFANVSYAWTDCEDWTPFLGIGGEAEFGSDGCGSNNSCNTACGTTSTTTTSTACNTACNTSCDTSCGSSSNNSCCQKCSLSQWGVWVKGGVAFN